jgi:hypothetical protein
MIKNVIILTLSDKFGDYCIAAYDISTKKLIRLIKDTTVRNGIPKEYAWDINLLDEVTVKVISTYPQEHQIENILIDLNYGLQRTGKIAKIEKIYNLSAKYPKIFGDLNFKLSNVESIDHSLEIIRFENMHIFHKIGNDNKKKTKASFSYSSKPHLEYSVTDSRLYNVEEQIITSGYAIISLPATEEWTETNGYFKYVSAIYPDQI